MLERYSDRLRVMLSQHPYLSYLSCKKLPQLERWTIERLDYDLEWLWCSFLLLLSICNDSDDLDKYFELALRLVPAEYSI